ncbi:DUF1883 domain-containing protein [Polyangium spumosum]|nr:DUF1883 domain-containing protein [Polyangium spumosum]
MDFLKYELDAGPDDIIEVTLSSQANVRLLDSANFQRYRRGASHRCIGGLAKQSPFHLRAPHSGRWYVAIDLGGYKGNVRASVRVLHGHA